MDKIFTGVVQGTALILKIEENNDHLIHIVQFPEELLTGLAIGDSVSYNGCCLTVAASDNSHVGFYLFTDTLLKTALGRLAAGDKVNIERVAV